MTRDSVRPPEQAKEELRSASAGAASLVKRVRGLPFRARVTASLAVCLLPAVTIAMYSWAGLQELLEAAKQEEKTDEAAGLSASLQQAALECRRFEKDMLLNFADREASAQYMEKWSAQAASLEKGVDELNTVFTGGPMSHDVEGRAVTALLSGDLAGYRAGVKQTVAAARTADQTDPVALNKSLEPHKAHVRRFMANLETVRGHIKAQVEACERDLHGSLEHLAARLLTGIGIAAALGTTAVIFLPRLLTRRVRQLGEFADAIRSGDLSARSKVGGEDEVGKLSQALNEMLDNLERAIEREWAAATAEAEARQAGESKMRFMANMSHEIRTPMTAILGFTDLLLDPTLAPDARMAHTETIRRNGNHLLGVINDILDLSKLQAEKMVMTMAPAQACRLVAEAAAMVRVRAAEKGLPLNVVYEFPMPEFIQTDGQRLRQVLVNLLSNAVKFTEKGFVRLVARADGLSAPDPYITFRVIDTGVGMSEDQLARLFQPFTQVDDSATRRVGGTGLGLCISKELAERLGGTLEVDSRPGEGTTFTLRLPVGDMTGVRLVHNAEEALAEAAPTPAAVAAIRLSGRILLAEDGPDNQRLIKLVLTKAGAEVDVVENGKLAMEAALAAKNAGKPYSLILMDMQMPVMDGYSATSELRELHYTGPIVALTAHAMPHDRQRCLLAGCNDYATKPIDRAVFLPLVEKHLTEAGAPAPAV